MNLFYRRSAKLAFSFFFAVMAVGVWPLAAQTPKLTSFVDPLIGSGDHGHVFVGASVPFGAVQLGPDNFYKGWDWCSGYNYQDSVIRGFAHTHLSGTGIGDLSDILFMPYTGEVKLDKGEETSPGSGYASLFSHQNEVVKPGYYAVKLANGVAVELAATERVGFHRYQFPASEDARVIIDLKEGINDQSTDTYLEQVDDYTLKGYRSSSGWAKTQLIYFAVKSSVPISDFTLYHDTNPVEGKRAKDKAVKGLISLGKSPGVVQFKVGISPVSADNALANIAAEAPDWNFEKLVQAADDKWNQALSKLTIETKNPVDKRIFYTAMYHTMINPALFNDHNGDYRGTDQQVYEKAPFANYSIFSTWDTYRSAHPLFVLTQPDRVSDMVNAMLAIYDQQGSLPVWHLMGYETGTMVGISSQQIIAEAYLKGIGGFDPERAFSAMKATAMSDLRGQNYLRELKPIPSDVRVARPVAQALELGIGDGSIALMANAMGKANDYAYFEKRARNYRHYFDASVGFLRGKMSDGSWNPNFDPLKSVRPYGNDFAEGNSWQYLWLVPQDVYGLIDLLGGEASFRAKLDTFFTIPLAGDLVDLTGGIGQYAHGNEPSHHITYLYAHAGEQWKTAEKVRYIMNEFYHDKPAGIIGNEDCGAMSAWYIFSAMGFYPVFPASGTYVIGSPAVDKATINLPAGKKFVVTAINNSPENIYVQSIRLNGKDYPHSYLLHSDITKGGTLEMTMGNKPNRQFGSLKANRPR
ncbi:GH92 family glycosyl hydrolase [Parapedobacter koreensis]|uniref:Alpha-1,2-mannosidase, putative n=1 Tax=Parapedobacter koreensis TaxID=332977 RepID=A0A1H7MHU4_9SPHI|nr:GH92 family glycosyl hydrolase [Parapedobacter koreensis]SEL10681.1 alpha-1,2-mannosidase, putative [Parapedobacter koreensis]